MEKALPLGSLIWLLEGLRSPAVNKPGDLSSLPRGPLHRWRDVSMGESKKENKQGGSHVLS